MATFADVMKRVLGEDYERTVAERESDPHFQEEQAERAARLLADSKKLSVAMPGVVISKD